MCLLVVYLDAAATAKYTNIDDIVVNTIATAMTDSWQNPSSLYAANVREKINKCRANIAEFIGAKSNEIYFTSGASESNNWAIKGWDSALRASFYKYYNVISTPIEHKSILALLNNNYLGATIHFCDVDEFGIVDCDSLERLLCLCNNNYEPILVSVCMANNEIGTIQDIRKIADLVHKYDGILHIDSTQAFGHIPINVEELGIDMMSCSGHKISPALRGIGFLYKKNCVNIHPLICGAQEGGLRGGTENTYGILGLNKALEFCEISTDKLAELCGKRDYFISILESKFGCKLNGHRENRLPNNISVTFPQNIMGESLLYMLDVCGIKVSVGSACNSKSIEPSYVLKAIGLSYEEAMKTVRFTLPDDITYKEVDFVIEEIGKCLKIIEA
jgi:cysteine desulfurase